MTKLARVLKVSVICIYGAMWSSPPTFFNVICGIDVGADDHISPMTRKDDPNPDDRYLTSDDRFPTTVPVIAPYIPLSYGGLYWHKMVL
jgi:hypothetical protein